MANMLNKVPCGTHGAYAPLAISIEALARLDDAIVRLSPVGKFHALNEHGQELLDNLSVAELTHLTDACEKNSSTQAEVRLAADGQVRVVRIAVIDLDLNNGRLCIIRDETLECGLRDALADSRRRYRDFTVMAGDFVWETGLDGRFNFVSPRGALGYSAAELMQITPAALCSEPVDELANPFIAATACYNAEISVVSREGELRALLVNATALHDAQGRFSGTRGTAQDVTAQRDSEAARRYAEWQIQSLTEMALELQDWITSRDSTNLAPLVQRLFGAHAVSIVTQDRSGDEVTWKISGEALTTEADGVNPIKLAIQLGRAPRSQIIAWGRWIVLVTLLRDASGRTSLLMVWRDKRFGDWSHTHFALAHAIAPIIGVGLNVRATLPPMVVVDPPTHKAGDFQDLFRRCVARTIANSGRSAMIVMTICGRDQGAFLTSPLPQLVTQIGQRIRAEDMVGLLTPTRLSIWLKAPLDAAIERRHAELQTAANHALTLLSNHRQAITINSVAFEIDPAEHHVDDVLERAMSDLPFAVSSHPALALQET